MKQILLILFFLTNICVAQTLKTHATDYFYYYEDTTKNLKGTCYFDVTVGLDTIYLGVAPPLVLKIQEKEPVKEFMAGKISSFWAKDEQGILCYVRLYLSEEQSEIHLMYQNIQMAFILE